jgi:hypothetical protein
MYPFPPLDQLVVEDLFKGSDWSFKKGLGAVFFHPELRVTIADQIPGLLLVGQKEKSKWGH